MPSRTTSRISILKTSASSRRRTLVACVSLWAGVGASLAAQSATVSGVLVLGGRGESSLTGAWVVLHQISMTGAGPVDSMRTAAGGRWRLRVPQVDTAAVYVVSAFRDGVAYFSRPLRVAAGRAISADTLVVYDTGSTGPPIRIRRRLVTIGSAKKDGARDVLEILELENPGRTTRIAADSLQPTWEGTIPRAAVEFQVGQGDFSPDAVARRADSVLVFGPIQPDATRQLSLGYVLPGSVRTVAIPIDQPTAEVDLLVEDTLTAVAAPTLRSSGVQRIENRNFARYTTDSLPVGTAVVLTFPVSGFRVERLLPLLVGAVALALGAGLLIALRRPTA